MKTFLSCHIKIIKAHTCFMAIKNNMKNFVKLNKNEMKMVIGGLRKKLKMVLNLF
jgi:hypothetical protein